MTSFRDNSHDSVERKRSDSSFKDLSVERKVGREDPKAKKGDGISKAEYAAIMKNMADFKVDMREEIQKMNSKVSNMEELMTDFIGKLNAALPQAAAAATAAGQTSSDENKVRNLPNSHTILYFTVEIR